MRIRELRQCKGMQQKELAEALGIAANTLSQYETGKRQPDFDTIQRIAEFFNVSIDYLFGNEKTPTPAGERKISDDTLMFALWGDSDDMDQADLDDVKRYADYVRERKRKK